MDEIITWEDLLNSDELSDYDEDYVNQIDREVAKEIPCENCGGECFARGKRKPGSYRVFSECKNCKRVIEF